MATNGNNSKNYTFKNTNVMEAKILKLTDTEFRRVALKSASVVFLSALLFLFNLLNVKAANYYWVGNSGNWNDVSHWATTSGGAIFHTTPPDSTDDVFFDANSFLSGDSLEFPFSTGQYIPSLCRNFSWLNTEPNVIIKRGPFYNVFLGLQGSIFLDGNSPIFYGLIFRSALAGNTAQLSNKVRQDLWFEGTGSWILMDDIGSSNYQTGFQTPQLIDIKIDSGEVFCNGHNINVRFVECWQTGRMNVTNSFLAVSGWINVSGSNNSKVYIRSNGWWSSSYYISGNFDELELGIDPYEDSLGYSTLDLYNFNNGAHFNKLSFNGHNDVFQNITYRPFSLNKGSFNRIAIETAFGGFVSANIDTCEKADFDCPVYTSGVFDTLSFAATVDSIYITNVSVNNEFKLISDAVTKCKITNPSWAGSANISLNSGNVCFQNVILDSINATGGAQFYADTSCVNMGGNTGFTWAPCSSSAPGYYWVGGTGNWSDVSHWATTSGGTTFHTTPPDSTSDVYFDANSGAVITVSQSPFQGIVCKNLVTTTNVSLDVPFINLYGSLKMFGGALVNVENLNFLGAGINTIEALNDTLPTYQSTTLRMFFVTSGKYNVLCGITTFSELVIEEGEVNFLGNSFGSGVGGLFVVANPGKSALVNLGSANFFLHHAFFSNMGLGGNIDADSAIFYLNSDFTCYITGIIFNKVYVVYTQTIPEFWTGFMVSNGCQFQSIICDSLAGTGNIIDSLKTHKITADNDSLLLGKNQINLLYNNNYDSLLIKGSHNLINRVEFPLGYHIEINNGDTLYLTDNLNLGSVNGGNLFSNSTMQPAYVVCNSLLPSCFKNTELRDIQVISSAPFYADTSSTDLGGNTGFTWAPCSPTASDYFWVGGTGNWNDVSHWATTSGGTTFYTVPPGINDDVYFDGNSFTSNSDTVKVIGAFATCNSFNWDVPQLAPVIIGSSIPLTIAGDLNLQSNFDWQVSDLRLTSSNGTILTNGNQLLSVTIDNNSTYQLADDIKCGYLDLLNTNFNSNNRTLTVGNIDCRQSPIEFGTSIINIVNDTNSFGLWSKIGDSTNVSNATINLYKNGGWLNFNNTKMNVIKEINVFANSSGVNSLITGPFNCGKLIADQIISITPQLFMGNRSFINKAVFKNNVYLNTGIIIDTLLLDNPGYTTQLTSGDTLFINNAFLSSYSSGLFGLITSTLPTYISMNNGIVCLNNISLQNIQKIGGAQFFAGNGCVDLGGNTGWQFAPCSNISDVWPGDANYDLTVNNYDVLNIGVAYGNTGPVRTGASLAYVAQPATDWSGYFANAVNHKHADTNGDGVVDNNDTAAISLNYGLTHPARLAGNTQQTFTGPQLYLQASDDSVAEGDTVEFDIYFGDAVSPINNIYGLAFTINVDTTFVDTVYSSFDFNGCWMGTEGIDLLTYNHPVWSQNKIDVALTRTSQTDTSGFGYLGRVGVVIVDNVGARILSPGYVTMPVSISNVYGIDYAQNSLSITTLGDSVVIDTVGTVNINNIVNLNSAINVFPNPTKDKINIRSSKINIESAELINTLGSVLIWAKAESNSIALNLELVGSGIYVLRIKTDKGVLNKKVQVTKYK